jgi:hypothetical protein
MGLVTQCAQYLLSLQPGAELLLGDQVNGSDETTPQADAPLTTIQ